jgi:FO synthase
LAYHAILEDALAGRRPDRDQALALAGCTDLPALTAAAADLRDRGHGANLSYSRKVFVPLTHLCRDVCHYCTFATPPRRGEPAFLEPDAVLEIARRGAEASCKEALFTLGDKPELRYRAAREALERLGFPTTLAYLRAMAERVLNETGLLPHLNPGVMDAEDFAALRPVAPSMGLMLESAADRLGEKGGPHWGSPDKKPAVRLEAMRLAGEAAVPFTTGILIGIGETRAERIESLLAIRDLHDRYGHIQEIIVQNFRAKPDTRMANAPEPSLDELLWTLAVTRVLFGPAMNIQVPPNLSPGALKPLVAAGINDWGGVSPVTPDFVNPEAPWPHLAALARDTEATGKVLVERLTAYPAYVQDTERWIDPGLRSAVLRMADSEGFAHSDEWGPGAQIEPPVEILSLIDRAQTNAARTGPLDAILARAQAGEDLDEADIVRLFAARGDDFAKVCAAADDLRQAVNGDTVTYVVNRNINYTNVCYFRCQFCAFSKGKLSEQLRGRPYDITDDEIARRTEEAWRRGGTEVCMQGGIHPDYTGATYLEICRIVKDAVPEMHVHAFSPLEVWQGAKTLGGPLRDVLGRLKDAGLGTLPGTAAEILDDQVRQVICPDKLHTAQWFEVMEAAHSVGFRTTATIMYGHVERPAHWARHLLRLRAQQKRTGGFTEFVPLPFVGMEAPIFLKGRARRGPTFREAVLMHAVARLALHPHFRNIQTSWVKMGPAGVTACLKAGANDMGGTLMNESITRAAGAAHGEELPPREMEALIRAAGRVPRQRTTAYGTPPAAQVEASFDTMPLAPVVNAAPRKRAGPRLAELARPLVPGE